MTKNDCSANCARYKVAEAGIDSAKYESIAERVNSEGTFHEMPVEVQARIVSQQEQIIGKMIAKNQAFIDAADTGLCPGTKGLLHRCQNPKL